MNDEQKSLALEEIDKLISQKNQTLSLLRQDTARVLVELSTLTKAREKISDAEKQAIEDCEPVSIEPVERSSHGR